MSEEKCQYCGFPLGFCEVGEYCTNKYCTYVDGFYNGPITSPEDIKRAIPPPLGGYEE